MHDVTMSYSLCSQR